MPAPHPRLRQHLSASGLLKTIRQCFAKMMDHRREASPIGLVDALMSGLAVFGLKYPSLLKFDEARNEAVIRSKSWSKMPWPATSRTWSYSKP